MVKPSRTLSVVSVGLLSVTVVITLVLLNTVRFDGSLRALFNRDHGIYDHAMVDRSKKYLLNTLPLIEDFNDSVEEISPVREEVLMQFDLAYAYLNIGRYLERYGCVEPALDNILKLRNDIEKGANQTFQYQIWAEILTCYDEVDKSQDELKANLIERALIDSRANQFWMNVGVIAVYVLAIMLWFLLEIQHRLGRKSETEKEAWQSRAMTDHLTSTYNRMALHETLESLVEQWPVAGESVGLVFYDIDHFKKFNDTFGHVAGDKALRQVADTVNKLLPMPSDHYRFGGEEFFIVNRETEHSEVVELADQILSTVQKLNIENPNSETGFLTVSVGVYMLEKRNYTAEELITKVDELLYVAKKHGRNRVIDEFTGLDG
ncbi:MAG: GGDEF domain-containing protein [Marinomonas atlantica]|nr:GGDEF domain-containing protein [Marinomonas atlantica]